VKPDHKYRWWIAIAIPVSVILGTVIGTPHTLGDAILYLKIALNLILGVVVWGFLFLLSELFDRLMPWRSSSHTKRWIFQLAVSLPMVSAIVWGLVWVRNDYLGTSSSLHLFLYTDVPIISLLAFGIQLLFQRLHLKQTADETMEPSAAAATLAIKNLGKTHIVPVVDVAYIYRINGLNYLRRFGGQDIISDQAIKAYEEMLDAQMFFRINRKLLVSRQAITSYKVTADRKTILELRPPWKEVALLDKNRLSDFKKWLLPE